jgi:hypothetical protein
MISKPGRNVSIVFHQNESESSMVDLERGNGVLMEPVRGLGESWPRDECGVIVTRTHFQHHRVLLLASCISTRTIYSSQLSRGSQHHSNTTCLSLILSNEIVL